MPEQPDPSASSGTASSPTYAIWTSVHDGYPSPWLSLFCFQAGEAKGAALEDPSRSLCGFSPGSRREVRRCRAEAEKEDEDCGRGIWSFLQVCCVHAGFLLLGLKKYGIHLVTIFRVWISTEQSPRFWTLVYLWIKFQQRGGSKCFTTQKPNYETGNKRYIL